MWYSLAMYNMNIMHFYRIQSSTRVPCFEQGFLTVLFYVVVWYFTGNCLPIVCACPGEIVDTFFEYFSFESNFLLRAKFQYSLLKMFTTIHDMGFCIQHIAKLHVNCIKNAVWVNMLYNMVVNICWKLRIAIGKLKIENWKMCVNSL